jgi:hypothetical protein
MTKIIGFLNNSSLHAIISTLLITNNVKIIAFKLELFKNPIIDSINQETDKITIHANVERRLSIAAQSDAFILNVTVINARGFVIFYGESSVLNIGTSRGAKINSKTFLTDRLLLTACRTLRITRTLERCRVFQQKKTRKCQETNLVLSLS